MTLFAKPVIGLSLTEPDECVLRYTALLARSFRWNDVHFLHVVPPERGRKWDPRPWQEKLRAAVSRVFDGPKLGCQLTFHAAEGPRLDGILQTAVKHERDLIVLGHRRMRSGRRSLARRTAMVAPSSVWLVPEGSRAEIREILVPTDFSQPSADSLQVAVDIARAARRYELRALHVFFDPSSIRFDEYREEVLGKEQQLFEEFVASVKTQGVNIEPIFHECADASKAILRVAERCGSDLIVMNTRGRSQAAFVLLGSTTSETMAATSVPLLAVKHFGARMSLIEALTHRRGSGKSDAKSN